MPVDPWDPADQKLKTRLPGTQSLADGPIAIKKTRGHEIPDDAHEGFMSVSDLLKGKGKGKGKKRARSPTPVQSEDEDEDDDDDEAEQEMLFGVPVFDPAAKGRAKGMAMKAKAVAKKKAKAEPPITKTKTASKAKGKVAETKQTKATKGKSTDLDDLPRRSIDFLTTSGPTRRRMTTPPMTPPSSSRSPSPEVRRRGKGTTKFSAYPPSPISDESLAKITKPNDQNSLSPNTAALVGFSQLDTIDLSWDDEGEFDEPMNPIAGPSRVAKPPLVHSRSAAMMPPPPVPLGRPSVSPVATKAAGPFDIRPGARRGPDKAAANHQISPMPQVLSSSVSPMGMPQRPGRIVDDSSPLVPQRVRRRRDPGRPRANRKEVNELVSPVPPVNEIVLMIKLDLDVGVSGSEQSADESSGEESESDRRFANNFQPTQAPAGYDQRAVYAAGLSTQAAPKSGLNFRSAQVVNARKEAFFAKARKPVLLTDSEGDGSGDENEYQLGSFVVDDESGFDSKLTWKSEYVLESSADTYSPDP
jgi:ATP-dependent DNA helicase MPH1